MFFGMGGCCYEDRRYDNSKSTAVAWSCHSSRYQLLNMLGNGTCNNWEKEEGSTNEIVGIVRKEGSGTIWLEKRGCVQSRRMARAN